MKKHDYYLLTKEIMRSAPELTCDKQKYTKDKLPQIKNANNNYFRATLVALEM